MALRYFNNTKHKVNILATANHTIVIAGNNTVSNVTHEDSDVVISGTITQIQCGSPSGNAAYWQVQRGSNTIAILDSTAQLDYRAAMALTLDNTANLVLTLHRAVEDEGYIFLEVKKTNA